MTLSNFESFEHAVEYVITCVPSDEKQLIKNVNKFLSSLSYRKMYKWKQTGIRNLEQPEKNFRYSHYYCQFMKQVPRWHFDLTPNRDLDERFRIPEKEHCAWSLYMSKVFTEYYEADDHVAVEQFFTNLVGSLGFEAERFHTYYKNETRI